MFVDSIEKLHQRLREYIEAVYHVADKRILDQRRALLEREGVLRQPAFIESTRAYAAGQAYDTLLAGAPQALLELALRLASREPRLLHDPPYEHQGEALRALLFEGKDIVVYTGTGSGKTECFTVPILMRLLSEAAASRASFERRAVRALVLYPMNALVNDQLGRVRKLLGDVEVADTFKRYGGRPATFGQYTGRTPFAGVRKFDAKSDGRKIKPFADFYVDTVEKPSHAGNEDALRLRSALESRGRWPAKPDLLAWYGADKMHWDRRLHTLPEDRELIARHEFCDYVAPDGRRHGAPPDVLITNYSMLEYMLMRPVERSIFDRTRAWLDENRDQTFFLVLDEAHMYRGAQGTEVALLIRRLLERLDLAKSDRQDQLRIAVTSASFSSGDRAKEFAAQLVGRSVERFISIGGRLALRDEGGPGSEELANALNAADIATFYSAPDPALRFEAVRVALEAFSGAGTSNVPRTEDELARRAYDALEDAPVRRRMVALTQSDALQIPALAAKLFPGVESVLARGATEALAALCTFARPNAEAANLLPSRIHTFHRGLPGLWACVNQACPGGGGVIGALYGQPRDRCDRCSARVFELFTCRSCGAPYVRAACAGSEVRSPKFLWGASPTTASDGTTVLPIDVLLDFDPTKATFTDEANLDTFTGIVVPGKPGEGSRRVGFYHLDADRKEPVEEKGRLYYRCGVCGDDNDTVQDKPPVRRSTVEDHQTSGQGPFYALIHEQLGSQPGRLKKPAFLARETPLAGRKVLIFSDGRQKAARLAAELGRSALLDSLRPLLLAGYREKPGLNLGNAYAALLIGAAAKGVELRATDERYDQQLAKDVKLAREAREYEFDDESMQRLRKLPETPKDARPVTTHLLRVIQDKHTGLSALALAGFSPAGPRLRRQLKEKGLSLPKLSEEQCSQLVSLWLAKFIEQKGCTIFSDEALEPGDFWRRASPASGAFEGVLAVVEAVGGAAAERTFREEWLPTLRNLFRSSQDDEGEKQVKLDASKIELLPLGPDALSAWGRCDRCSRVQCAVLPGAGCVHCSARGTLRSLSPESDALTKFEARKGFYRANSTAKTTDATSRPLVAREHSAALTGISGEVQSRAERHELAFQDITAASIDGMRSPIDVLSCTTTMEVGIDIGDLSAVALRNMPPGRANYQQRAGRAGRRGNAVATVLAYADQDGHNQHFFENPQQLIKARVPDPTLNLENPRIARRHVNAFVLQRFLAHALPSTAASDPKNASLFGSLGTVGEFVAASTPVNFAALRAWLSRPVVVADLRAAVERWLPAEVHERTDILNDFAQTIIDVFERKLGPQPRRSDATANGGVGEAFEQEDLDPEDEVDSRGSLLDYLLYHGILPKYAFPTDLVAFRVFEATMGLGLRASEVRNKVRYAPQRALPIALSEYAPGKTVFIDGRAWVSSALHSPTKNGLQEAFSKGEYFRACEVCGYAKLYNAPTPTNAPCQRCGDETFGASIGMKWIRPPGFAHAITLRPKTEPDEAQYSRPGRAVLQSPSPTRDEWRDLPGGVGVRWHLEDRDRWEVIVTNRGPREQGFRACGACGAIEPYTDGRLAGPHQTPTPNEMGMWSNCPAVAAEVVSLGTRFRTDVLLLRFELPTSQRLVPRSGGQVFQIALSSLATALSLAASVVLEIESGEVLAGYRTGLAADDAKISSAEIFLYDQLDGGAGYVVELSRRLDALFTATRSILSHGPSGSVPAQPACDRACYGCLLSFKNSYEHSSLDRRLALDLLDAATSGRPATLGVERTMTASNVIAHWLAAFGNGEVLRDTPIGSDVDGPRPPVAVLRADGRIVVPALCHPFSPNTPDDEVLVDVLDYGAGGPVDVVPLNYLDVSRALPAAMEKLRNRLI